MHSLCDLCQSRAAILFISQTVDEENHNFRLCLECARERAQSDVFLREILARVEEEMAEAEENEVDSGLVDWDFDDEVEFPDFDADETLEDEDENDSWMLFAEEDVPPAFLGEPKSQEWALRCVCGTTWDKIRKEGRVGCATCYSTFREAISGVMTRVQSSLEHVGKAPSAAARRERQRENLQKRRQHALEMLQNRLKSAVASEDYEEAAKLRDKIREASDF